ncbi:unnamed protein product [Clavelina lepadiformis]|uniref:VWFA domain-containing protein n=1 Tax=Clavelina lepadiformis TaxID=159417 RepID=A0ABP0F9E4_CLALP
MGCETLFLLAIIISISTIQAKICWNCDANSIEECRENGKFITCPSFDDICSTVVRMNQGLTKVMKGCKQQRACLNNQIQNWGGNSSMQCDGTSSSVCRCCCFENYCNENVTCVREERTICPALPGVVNQGNIFCTNSNRVDSRCFLICRRGASLFNPNFRFRCLPNGKWSRPVPCCAEMERCPPRLLIDLVILMHVRDAETFAMAFPVTTAFLEKINFGPDSVHYSIQYYSGDVHKPAFNFRDLLNLTTDETLEKLESEVIYQNTADNKVNTGAALQYIHDVVFGSEGDRPDVRNVVVLITDENSDDDVKVPAKMLRDSGAFVYSYFFQSDFSAKENMAQLREISAVEPHIIVVPSEGQFGVTTQSILDDFLHNLCPVECSGQP